ncbi:MAG: hypothetical protein IJS39_07330 [Synergistaceae bacterium]|nr:hypothetical protein [Synergistaceae bacterium]
MRQIGIITYEHDPMYDVKRWLFCHSNIGVNDGDCGEALRQEKEAHEAELDARNPLMCKFTKRVMKAIREAWDNALNRGDLKTAERLRQVYRKYKLRLVHFQHSEQENFYLFCPECYYSQEEESKVLIALHSGKDMD